MFSICHSVLLFKSYNVCKLARYRSDSDVSIFDLFIQLSHWFYFISLSPKIICDVLLSSKPVNTERQLHCRLTDVNCFRDVPIGIMFLHCSHCFSEKTRCFRLSIYRENDLFISLERRRTVLFREAEGELATTSLEFE